MTVQLQPFEHDKSRYERPNQEWICGWTAEGAPCRAGPRGDGRCGAGAECAPIREGDRWHCTRPPSFGGPCEDGPNPNGSCSRPIMSCQPVPSARALLASLTTWTVAATVGILLVMIAGPLARSLVSPGPLVAAHSGFGDDCAACHTQADNALAEVLSAALGSVAGPVQNGRCRTCHDLGANADFAHAVVPDVLASSSARQAGSDRSASPLLLRAARVFGSPVVNSAAPIPCTTCHVEHHGRRADLQGLSLSRCQACHRRQFDSFGNGHPDFDLRPLATHGRVAFDHFAHAQEFFAMNERKFNCVDCHGSDVAGRPMLAGTFASVCSGCHGEELTSEVRGTAGRDDTKVNEGAGREGTVGHDFTRFAHRPHLTVPDNDACLSCHVMLAKRTVRASRDTVSSDFLPIRKQTCAGCHTPAGAGDSCLLCHVYHVEQSASTLTSR